MSSFIKHNRNFCGAFANTWIFLLLGMAIFGSYTWLHLNQSRALANAAEETAPSFWNSPSLSNVDLFTLIDEKPLYALSTYDKALYQKIFAAQQINDWSQANALIKRLHDSSLVGHVLYDRYTNPAYKAGYAELRDWMVRYGDHPNAYKIYQLAQKRRNNDPAALPAPQMAKKLFGSLEFAWLKKEVAEEKPYTPVKRDNAAVHQLMSDIKRNLSNDRATAAYNALGQSKTSRMLTNVEYDSLLSNIAASYFYNGKYDTAYNLASQSVKRSDESVPYAHWIAGLSAWKNKDYRAAAQHFKSVMASHNRNPWMLSAASFWASRAYDKLGDSNTSNDWLQEAASYPRTFYGLIAQEKLGNQSAFSWDAPVLTPTLIETLKSVTSGQRALALIDLGRNDLAKAEFDQINPNGNKRVEKALITAAYEFKLPDLAIRLGNAINQPDGKLYDVALYPIVPWKGDTRIGISPALVNALIRQESRFSVNAKNSSGAKGLMQLMPRTAQLVSDKSYRASDLHKPEVNIVLGQRYIRHLLDLPQVQGNMIYLAAAYNAGPTTLARWLGDINEESDPLLFVESIPVSETRAFVERVMTNYWIYNQRLKQDNGTLHDISQGDWPVYNAPAGNAIKVAAAN